MLPAVVVRFSISQPAKFPLSYFNQLVCVTLRSPVIMEDIGVSSFKLDKQIRKSEQHKSKRS